MQDLVDGCDDDPGRPVDSLGDGTRRVAELTGDLSSGKSGEDLGVVLCAGQDVVIRDVEERDCSGLVGAVDERRDVVGADELGVQRGLGLQSGGPCCQLVRSCAA